MGFLKSLFLKAPIKEYLCDRCSNVLDNPIHLEPCDHAFCSSCIFPGPRAITTTPPTHCPVMECRQPVTNTKKASRNYLNLINYLELNCPNVGEDVEDVGCGWRGQLGELQGHSRDCEYSPDKRVDCDKGCGATFKRKEKGNHNCVEYYKKKMNKYKKRVRELDPEAPSSTSSSSSEEDENLPRKVPVPIQSSSQQGKGPQGQGNENTVSPAPSQRHEREIQPEMRAVLVGGVGIDNGDEAVASSSASSRDNSEDTNHSNNGSTINNIQFLYQTLPPAGTSTNQQLSTRQSFNVYQFDLGTGTKTIKFKSPLMDMDDNDDSSFGGYRFLSSTIKHKDKFYSIGGTYNPSKRAEVDTAVIYTEGILEGVLGPGMGETRKEFGLTVMGNTIYVVGGCHHDLAMNSGERLKILGTNRLPDEWEYGKKVMDFLKTPRGALSASSLNGGIYAIGGRGGGTVRAMSSVEVYNPSRNEWMAGVPLLTARSFHKSIVLGGRIYAIGGCDESQMTSGSVEWFDPREGRWTEEADMNTPRKEFGLVDDRNGNGMYAIGGSQYPRQSRRSTPLAYNPTLEFYDERNNRWELIDYPVNLDQNVDWTTICSTD